MKKDKRQWSEYVPRLGRSFLCAALAVLAPEVCRAQQAYEVPEGGTWEGPYNPIPGHQGQGQFSHCCEIAHAILLGAPGEGHAKVLLIQSNGDRWIWDPASPSSATSDHPCDFPIAPGKSLFCAGHSANGNGDIVVHGGHRESGSAPCPPQPTWSYVLEPANRCWSPELSLLTPTPVNPPANFQNLGYWYPGSVRIFDGRVLSVGGGSSPLTNGGSNNICNDTGVRYFIDGWQIFDPSQGGWIGKATNMWFNGLQANATNDPLPNPSLSTPAFNYYPLVIALPNATSPQGVVFSAVVTNFRTSNDVLGAAYAPVASVSARMDLAATGWPNNQTPWTITSQIMAPNGTTPRNLYYPSAILRPLILNANGFPNVMNEVMVIGGTDNNVVPVPHRTGRGRPALAEVSQITSPEQGSPAWASNGARFPNLIHPRIYANVAILPTGEAFVVGGSRYDFFPLGSAPDPQNRNMVRFERVAEPVYFPEMMDLLGGANPWRECTPHVSPRLYHSLAVVLPDGRVLVVGGYRGSQSPAAPPNALLNWTDFAPGSSQNPHSDLEIYSPEYLFAGARPEITSLKIGATETTTIPFGSQFELTVRRTGAANPVGELGSICLLSCASVTHHFDWDQRYVGLHFTPSAVSPTTKVVVQAPANGAIAPPGYYMLFVNTSEGATTWRIPSLAKFVKIE